MGHGAAYAWGCIGGLGAGVALYLLPALEYARRTRDYSEVWGRPLIVILVMITVLTALSGLGPLILLHVTTTGAAIKAGIAAQGTIKGVARGVDEATKGKPNKRRAG